MASHQDRSTATQAFGLLIAVAVSLTAAVAANLTALAIVLERSVSPTASATIIIETWLRCYGCPLFP